MTSKIKVAVCGAMGKMGREAVRTIIGDEELQLTGGVDVRGVGLDLGVLVGSPPLGVTISSDLEGLLKTGGVEVLVDFTNPQAVRRNLRTSLENRVYSVVGTTGLT
ncbi:MAG: 4-hydroxy-tetrahydrodipicolinate reductase, partial [Syntrophomonadaceae bacterium]|nr:4-hydroxy-tetrahydrodipicolinate reductase [Syntrophomonadaceae bacterium]